MTVSKAARSPVLLWTALVAMVLVLGLPVIGARDGSAMVTGRELPVRVLLVVAVVRTRHLVTGALVFVGFTAALLIRALTPTGAVLLTVAVGTLLWQRRALVEG